MFKQFKCTKGNTIVANKKVVLETTDDTINQGFQKMIGKSLDIHLEDGRTLRTSTIKGYMFDVDKFEHVFITKSGHRYTFENI